MIITRKQFQAYLRVQHSGKYNMYSEEARQATNLDENLYKVMQLSWEDLNKAFIGTNINHVSITVYDTWKKVCVKTLRYNNLDPNLILTYLVFGGQADVYIGSIEYVPTIGAIKLHAAKEQHQKVHLKDLLIYPDETHILIDWYDGFEEVTHFEVTTNLDKEKILMLYRQTEKDYQE